jgi:GT2 family glycosyltransferase
MQPAGDHPDIDVIVVNYNAGAALVRCLQSLLGQELPVQIIVVDNASADGSITELRRAMSLPGNVEIIENHENLGFARAINAAARELPVGGNYLLILNPDCEMLPGSLQALCAALDSDSGAALAGPLVVDSAGHPMRGTLRRFPGPWSGLLAFSGLWRLGRWIPFFDGVEKTGLLPAETTRAEAVSGACMLLRKSEFLAADCMDGDYGLHCEDLDLMYRLNQRGWHSLFVPSARVFHAQGVSSASRPMWVHWQKHRGMQRFFMKFQARQTSPPLRWLVIAGIWVRFAVTLPIAWVQSRSTTRTAP